MAPKKRRNLSSDERLAQVVNQLASGYRTIGEMVYAVLKEAIMSGTFEPGEWLGQESLATAIGVSRIPVRTALLQLEAEGLVTFHPHRGARVRNLTAAQIAESYRLRTLLESYALRLSMSRRITEERLDRLRGLAKQLDEEPEGGEFLETRIRFYRDLYDADNNPLLVQMIEELRSMVGRYLLSYRILGDRTHGHVHSDLVEHVAAGDLASAESWVYSHLEQVRKGIEALALDEEAAAAAKEAKADEEDGGEPAAESGEASTAR